MATNPMQRKARNSFLLGVMITLLISALIIALLVVQLKNYIDKEKQERANSVRVWVLSQNVISGQIITTDMLSQQIINKNLVPGNAIGDMSILSNYALTDKEGNEIVTEYKNNNATLFIYKNNNKYEMKIEDETENYYIEVNGEKQYIELTEVPIIAKIDMNKNTVITIDMISKSDEKTTNDLRKQEYNVLALTSQLETGEYVDVRLSLPNGLDYIVISKKQVEFPQINGVDSSDTVWLKMREDEIITMNNAIVESYRIAGSKLYVAPYIEAGVQDAAIPTYIPSVEAMKLIQKDPNIINVARNELNARYRDIAGLVRNEVIDPLVNNSGQEGEENVKTKVNQSIVKTQETRKEYLQSLGGQY